MFEWDGAKRATNLAKHGLDFVPDEAVFDGRLAVEVSARADGEVRRLTIREVAGVFVTTVWTWGGATWRIISTRRSRDVEKQADRRLYG